MDKKFVEALKRIAEKINSTGAKWMVFGSCGLALNGMQIQPDDIDILTDELGAIKIRNILMNFETEPIKKAHSEIFDSTMNRLLINGCLVEVMGNFKVKSRVDNQWHDTTYLLNDSIMVDLDNHKIPILPLAKSIELYKLMGRDKDLVKIQKIEMHIKNTKAN